jgi:hypothetical protein
MNLVPVFSHPDAPAAHDDQPVGCAETPMRLTLAAFGVELDITLGRQSEPADDDAPGSYTSYPVGFVRDPDPIWEDSGSSRQFEPE